MRLYHFTAAQHWPSIDHDGVLKVTESNIGAPEARRSLGWQAVGSHVGPDVVWLTDDAAPTAVGLGLNGTVDKTAVRITVELPPADAHPWRFWSASQGIDPRWFDVLACNRDPDTWWVVARPIPRSEWIEVAGPPVGGSRNGPCPCGSGLKTKRCHLGGRLPVWSADERIGRAS